MPNAGPIQSAGRRRTAHAAGLLKLALGAAALAALPQAGQAVAVRAAPEQPGSANFAVPPASAGHVATEPRENGRIERGWLGLALQLLDEELAGVLGAPGGKGALVASVEADSPAARGGLKLGDILIGVAGKAVQHERDLDAALAEAKPSSALAVTVLRSGRRMEHQVVAGEPSKPARRIAAGGEQQGARQASLGLSLAARREDGAGSAGVLVAGVVPGSAAEELGLRAGDVILSVDDRAVATPQDVAGAVDAARNAGRPGITVQVERGERRTSMVLPWERG